MRRLTPRDVHIGAVVGGAIIGVSLSVLGALAFNSALGPNGVNQGILTIVGSVYSTMGLLFLLVSIIILPALRAMRLESAEKS